MNQLTLVLYVITILFTLGCKGDTAVDQVPIIAQAPIAHAGSAQTAAIGATISLDGGKSSDLGGAILSFHWSFIAKPVGSHAILINPVVINPKFTLDVAGQYIIQLVVNNGRVDSSPATVTISTHNSAPVAQAGPAQTSTQQNLVQLDGTASSDIDGNRLSYDWSLSGAPVGSQAALLGVNSVAPTLLIDLAGQYHVQLVVNDGLLNSTPSTTVVSTQNSAPVATPGSAQTVAVGGSVLLDGSGSTDVDGNALTYRWALIARPLASRTTLSTSSRFDSSFTADVAGQYVAQLIVNDGLLDSAPVTVTISTLNSAPVANAGAAQTRLLQDVVLLDGSLSADVDGDNLTYSWSLVTAPAGSNAVLTGAATVSPSFAIDQPGQFVVQLTVHDGQLSSAQDHVVISTTNSAPVVVARAVQNIAVGSQITLSGGASDIDGDALFYYWSMLVRPSGSTVVFSSNNTPNPSFIADFPGTYIAQLIVNDGQVASKPITTVVTATAVVLDSDGDGLLDSVELALGTDPYNPDSDGDGLNDGAEVNAYGTNPLNTDTDGDTINDGVEVNTYNTDPTKADTDGDGFNDNVEINGASNPIDPAKVPGGATPQARHVATVNTPVIATQFSDSTTFIYSGVNPVQTGVVAGTIDVSRVAILRGQVFDELNKPLLDVVISILGHPEFGQTKTSVKGWFDIAVNGGTSLMVNYQKAGYLPIQRKVKSNWQDFGFADDVVMIPLDLKVTTVSLAATTSIQVARGSVVADADGSRQSTLIFTPGTTATMTLANGTVQPLKSINVRATEYTVGADGMKRMPGPLPATSGYTYAVELSIDEAIAAQATQVNFSQPVYNYVENFLGFPDGMIVPSGYYDRQQGKWVASDNGKVIRIISITAGMADVDVTGDGVADSGFKLTNINMTNAERTQLALTYAVNSSLWRVPITHFTPWDHNFPFGPAADARAPDPKAPTGGDDEPGDPCKAQGSIIGCESQTLGEQLNIVGAPYHLRYQSQIASATQRAQLSIPLIGSQALPASTQSVELRIAIAGQLISRSFTPKEAQQPYIFTWDGKDVYGRPVQGSRIASIRIGYSYQLEYKTPAAFAKSFAQLGGATITGVKRSVATPIIVWQKPYRARLVSGGLDAEKMGRWGIEEHHIYDKGNNSVYFGDGSQAGDTLYLSNNSPIQITSVAGMLGATVASDPDITASANTLTIGDVTALAVGPDGLVYYGDASTCRVYRINANGTRQKIAGNTLGSCVFSVVGGDGGLAVNASLRAVTDIAFSPEGELYIADGRNIRRVDRNGIISTQTTKNADLIAVHSNGKIYTYVKNSSRTRVKNACIKSIDPLTDQSSIVIGSCPVFGQNTPPAAVFVRDMVFDGADNLYIAHNAGPLSTTIWRLDPSGTVLKVAGDPLGMPAFEGASAPSVNIGMVNSIAVNANGSSLFLHAGNKIWRVDMRSGQMLAIAGTGQQGTSSNGVALASPLGLSTPVSPVIAITNDHSLYFNTLDGPLKARVRKVASASAAVNLGIGKLYVPDPRAPLVHVFGVGFLHEQTLDALTYAVLRSFSYDANGRLIAIVDRDGNSTNFLRGTSGYVTEIIAPGGQRTTLTYDANGNLASVTNPAGEVTGLSYHAGTNLLSKVTRPGGGVSTFIYDTTDRLIQDNNSEGGSTTLLRTELANGYSVTKTRASGIVETYSVETLSNGHIKRSYTNPAGGTKVVIQQPDGTTVATDIDGTVILQKIVPGPVWGMMKPMVSEISTTLPSGKVRTITKTSVAQFSNPSNPLSFTSLTTTMTDNGAVSHRTYVAATRTLSETTAAGRVRNTVYDTQGRVVSFQYDVTQDKVLLSYDVQGNLISTAQGSDVRSYSYDAMNRRISLTDGLGQRTAYTYDAADRLTSVTQPSGAVVALQYDADGRHIGVTMPNGAQHALMQHYAGGVSAYTPPVPGVPLLYSYDVDGQRSGSSAGTSAFATGLDAAGRLAKNSDAFGISIFTYPLNDSGNRVSTLSYTPVNGLPESIAMTYDGSLVTTTIFSGQANAISNITFNSNWLPSQIQLSSGADIVTTPLLWDADRELASIGNFTINRLGLDRLPVSISDGVGKVGFTFDTSLRLSTYTLTVNTVPSYNSSMQRNAIGRITQRTDSVMGVQSVRQFGYDNDGQLLSVRDSAGNALEQYAYDMNGNLTSKMLAGINTIISYDAMDRVSSAGGVQYGYDERGFLTQRGGDAFTYDTMGRLLSVTVAGQKVAYAYDALGRRTARTDAGGKTEYFYANPYNAMQVTHIRAADGVLVTLFYERSGLLIAFDRGVGAAALRYYVATDTVGSPLVISDASGVVVKETSYSAFGEVLSDSNPVFSSVLGFAGGLSDAVTGMLRFTYRDYEPATAHWTGRDLILFNAGQANIYAYSHNDPVNFRDPSGLFCIGASFYAGLGGGAKICFDSDGRPTVCAEVGIGLGGGAGVEPFASGGTSTKFGPSIGVGAGPVGAGVSGDYLTGCAGGTFGVSGSFEAGLKPEGKIAYEKCQKY